MRILYVSLDPRQPITAITGGATHMREATRALREEGHEVEVSASGTESVSIPSFEQSSSKSLVKKFIPNGLWNAIRDLNDIRIDRAQEKVIARKIVDFKPDAVYERNSYLFASCARAAATAGVPYFIEINGPTIEERKKLFGAPLAAWQRRIEAFQFAQARGIFTVSEPLRRYLADKGADKSKICVVPNGARAELFDNIADKRIEIRKKLGIEGPTIGFVGSIAGYHSLERLFLAMKDVAASIPNAVAVVVGGGPLLDETKAKAAQIGVGDKIVFTGSVKPEEVPAYISAFDAAVLPRTADYTSPIKLFEYGAAGIPVVAPKTEPVAAIIGSKKNGILLEEGDSLGEALIDLLKNPARMKEMGASFKRLVLDRYTWRHGARKTASFMAERMK